MYSPTTRLLTILELLQSYRQMSGSEMARRLEVDGRTIRRYIVMLQDMGIPVEAERGPYGTYQLQRGYKLPPLMYTDAEVLALTLGLIAIREFSFPVDVAAVEGALAKTERVMPEKLLHQARALQEAITFNIELPPAHFQNESVATLSLAAQQQTRVWLRYRSWNGDASEREFDPYGIVFNEGYWYTAGYCHLRQGLRTFRLDRIIALESVERSFERPEQFDTLDNVMNSLASMPGAEEIEVLFKTSLENAEQVISPHMGTLEQTNEGVIFRCPPHQLDWIAYFLIRLEFPVIIRKPNHLRDELRKVAAKALQMIEEEPA